MNTKTKWILALPLLLISCQPCVHAFIDHGALKEAIYQAEGGAKAKKPYGVLSVPCTGKVDCGRIVDNSIRNSLKRYAKSGGKGDYRDFIQFFGNRWAPPIKGLKNDPTGLNRHWVGNVTALYEKRALKGI